MNVRKRIICKGLNQDYVDGNYNPIYGGSKFWAFGKLEKEQLIGQCNLHQFSREKEVFFALTTICDSDKPEIEVVKEWYTQKRDGFFEKAVTNIQVVSSQTLKY